MEGYEIVKDIGTGSSAVCKMAIRKSDSFYSLNNNFYKNR